MDIEETKKFINNEQNIDNAVALAKQIKEVTKGEWFTISGLARITTLAQSSTNPSPSLYEEIYEVNNRLTMLTLFGFIKQRVTKKKKMFKITLKMLSKIKKLKEDFAKAREEAEEQNAD